MKKILLASAAFLFFFQSVTFCQSGNDAVSNAVTNLKSLLTDHIIEKAYLHFDRPYAYYVAGEVVYFKAYVFMGERHQPSSISTILHVDLIDKNDVLMHSVAIKLANGTGWGDFALPDTLPKGAYRVRAYTEWMRNDKHPYFFDQYLSVSSVNNIDRVAQNTTQGLKPDLQFFPEGGNMVVDIPAKVAFKAIGTNGLSVSVKGIVVDNEHKEVAAINSAHLGMGMFSFIPEDGKTYKAMVTFGDGSQTTINLPAAQPKGITLSVNTDDPTKVSIQVRANRAYYKENLNKQYNLLVYYAGALKHFAPKLDNSILGLDLPASAFPTGILRVTLLSDAGEPLNERLAFIQNPDLVNLSVTANKTVYKPRENVQLNLTAKDKAGQPLNGSFSVSVVDESKILVDENAETTLLSYLLLTSEVKGHIEQPNYYFSNVNKDTRSALDALMLSQGYRRFDWKELETAAPRTAIVFVPEKGINISGVLKSRSGDPVANSAVTLIPVAGGTPMTGTTDANGRFTFADVQLDGGTKCILKALSSSGKKSELTLDQPTAGPSIDPGSPSDSKYDSNADILASFQNNQKQGIITASNSNTVLLKNDKASYPVKKDSYRSSNIGGPGHADQVIFGDEFKNSPSLSSGLNGRLVGVQFEGGIPLLTSSLELTTVGTMMGAQSSVGAQPMLIVIDGVDYGIGVDINDINPQTVETLELLKGPNAAIYGEEGGGGVLVITTRNGIENDVTATKEMSPGIFSIEPKGYYKSLEFYSPRYTLQNNTNLPDNRTTIFWKPDLITDADGTAAFQFFNADGKGTYRVEVQGIDSNGNIGMQVLRYKVE